jgi:hypothetical protein
VIASKRRLPRFAVTVPLLAVLTATAVTANVWSEEHRANAAVNAGDAVASLSSRSEGRIGNAPHQHKRWLYDV